MRAVPTWADAAEATAGLSTPEREVLELLLHLRLPTVDVLDALVGHRVDHVASALRDAGLAGVARATGGAGRGPGLLHLTDLGLTTLALARGEDPRRLARRHRLSARALHEDIVHARAVEACHQLLAAVAAIWPTGSHLVAWARPWRSTFRRPYARASVTVRLPARAEWVTPGGAGACLLVPDRGAMPVHAWARTLTLLIQLRATRPEVVPRLVIATTDERRRAAWCALLDEVAARLREAVLASLVATWDEARDGLVPPEWSLPALPVANTTTPLPPWTPRGGSRQLTVVIGGVPDMASLAGVALALSPTDREVLACIARHLFLPCWALASLLGWTERWARMRRDRLIALGLLSLAQEAEVGARAADELAECTRAGLELVAADWGLSLDESVRYHGVAGGGSADPIGQRAQLVQNLEHTLGVDRTFVRVHEKAAALRARGRDDALLEWRNAAACSRGPMRPDGYGLFRTARREHGFLLEYDRGTEKARDYRQKLGAYLDRLESGAHRRDFEGFPTVLFVTTDDEVEDRIARAVMAAEVGRNVQMPVLITTEGAFEADAEGVTGRIWRTPESADRRRWPAGGRNGPHPPWRSRPVPLGPRS